MGLGNSPAVRRRALGASIALCGIALAGVAGTPFVAIGTEVDQRAAELDAESSKQERKALARAAEILLRVDRGLVKDIASARKVSKVLGRAYPDDAEIETLIDALLDALATNASSRIFDTEQALAAAGALSFPRASRLLVRARECEVLAATAETDARRTKLLQRAVRAALKAERELQPDPTTPEVPVDPPADPEAPTKGTTTLVLNGTPFATQSVSASLTIDVNRGGALDFALESQVPSANDLVVTLAWSSDGNLFPQRSFVLGDRATGTMRRNGVAFDRDVVGEVRLTQLRTSGATVSASMAGTFQIAASDRFGNRLSTSGSFDVQEMPQTIER